MSKRQQYLLQKLSNLLWEKAQHDKGMLSLSSLKITNKEVLATGDNPISNSFYLKEGLSLANQSSNRYVFQGEILKIFSKNLF